MTQKALKLALEALETEVSIDWTNNDEFNASAEKMHDAITSLRQAIAELESQEPVAWYRIEDGIRIYYETKAWDDCVPLFTHPPQRTEQEPVTLPCCGYRDASAVKWNPLNGVVQCHNCGQNYTTPQRTWQGLTQSDFNEIYDLFANKVSSDFIFEKMYSTIEAKLKQKNGYAKEKNT